MDDTRTPRELYESMVGIEMRNLAWQRENDEPYDVIVATMRRILDLNTKIEETMANRPSAWQRNYR